MPLDDCDTNTSGYRSGLLKWERFIQMRMVYFASFFHPKKGAIEGRLNEFFVGIVRGLFLLLSSVKFFYSISIGHYCNYDLLLPKQKWRRHSHPASVLGDVSDERKVERYKGLDHAAKSGIEEKELKATKFQPNSFRIHTKLFELCRMQWTYLLPAPELTDVIKNAIEIHLDLASKTREFYQVRDLFSTIN